MIEIIPNWHPVFVHFTVALLSTASILFVLSAILPDSKYRDNILIVGRWNLLFGSLITIGTLLAGWQAYNTVMHDTVSHAAMENHRKWAIFTAIIFFILSFWQIKYHSQKRIHPIFIVLISFAFMLMVITAYKGGELVYRYGLGVMSLPQVDNADDHKDNDVSIRSHEHNDSH